MTVTRRSKQSTSPPVVARVDGRRAPAVAPAAVTGTTSLFEYLGSCQPPLDKKIIDIVLAQTKIPQDLRDDAAQEIRLAWSTLRPDTAKYKPGQIASYAHRIATHTALRLRRELGSSVRLPGSAFRKRKDGSSYVTPGMLAVPLDWNELESWFNADHAAEDADGVAAAALPEIMMDIADLSASDGEGPVVDVEEDTRRWRGEALERVASQLSRRQYRVMARLVAGESFEDIESRVSVNRGLCQREIGIAATILGTQGFDENQAQASS